MIRKLEPADPDRVGNLRLTQIFKRFLSSECRKRNLAPVRELLPQAEIYIYENAEKVQGIIGLDGKHIEGPFEKRKTRALSECVPKTRRQYIFINERASKSGAKDLMKPPEF